MRRWWWRRDDDLNKQWAALQPALIEHAAQRGITEAEAHLAAIAEDEDAT